MSVDGVVDKAQMRVDLNSERSRGRVGLRDGRQHPSLITKWRRLNKSHKRWPHFEARYSIDFDSTSSLTKRHDSMTDPEAFNCYMA